MTLSAKEFNRRIKGLGELKDDIAIFKRTDSIAKNINRLSGNRSIVLIGRGHLGDTEDIPKEVLNRKKLVPVQRQVDASYLLITP
jgi:hypothetical protein